MDLIHTEAFLSPLKGFLILSSSTKEERSNILHCKLDDLPRLYVIGNIRNVNEKISNLELGLKKYGGSNAVLEDIALRKYSRSRKRVSSSKGKEKVQIRTQKSGRHSSVADPLKTQSKMAQKKMVTEKDKLVELFHYPGYHEKEPTPLPNGIELDEILEKVVRAQSKTAVGKTPWAAKMLHRFFETPCIQTLLLDSFWWQYLHLYHPNQEIQGHLFERIAENYAHILLSQPKISNQDCILKFFPSLLSQAVYTCFCSCFPRSWFNTSEFKAQICDVFSEWLGGTLYEPRTFNKWDYTQLEPERSRREDLISGKGKLDSEVNFASYKDSQAVGKLRKQPAMKQISSIKGIRPPIKKAGKTVFGRKNKKQISPKVSLLAEQNDATTNGELLKENSDKDVWKSQQKLPKKKLKIALLPRESHPACRGPEFIMHRFNISGHSPLIQHFLQKHHAAPKAGCDIFLSRKEICKPIPESVQTYAEVVRKGFQILSKRHKAFTKSYLQYYRVLRNSEEQCKRTQERLRQEIEEEMKKIKAQKQRELLLFSNGLSTSD